MDTSTFPYEQLGRTLDEHVEDTLDIVNAGLIEPLTPQDLSFRLEYDTRHPASLRVRIGTSTQTKKYIGSQRGYFPSDFGWSKLKPLKRNVDFYLHNLLGLKK